MREPNSVLGRMFDIDSPLAPAAIDKVFVIHQKLGVGTLYLIEGVGKVGWLLQNQWSDFHPTLEK